MNEVFKLKGIPYLQHRHTSQFFLDPAHGGTESVWYLCSKIRKQTPS